MSFFYPSAPPVEYAGYPYYQPDQPIDRYEKLRQIAHSNEISNEHIENLYKALDGIEIVVIADDSGSMKEPADELSDPFDITKSRWAELKSKLSVIVDLATVFDENGVDIYFLNRPSILNVKSSQYLMATKQFMDQPNYGTPLSERLRQVLQEKKIDVGKRLLILIATDGEPSDGKDQFKKLLMTRDPISQIFVTILACTNEKHVLQWLNGLDNSVPNLDVVDDYQTEKKKVKKQKGSSYPFTLGDYLAKSLLGSINKNYDDLGGSKHCCSLI
jgi:DNA-directed RNA polymerase subunit N (RpoN/RPB10)